MTQADYELASQRLELITNPKEKEAVAQAMEEYENENIRKISQNQQPDNGNR